MNEKTTKHETAAEVLAEMRDRAFRRYYPKARDWADRIERALSAHGEAVGEIQFDPCPPRFTPDVWIERKAVFEDLAALPVGTKLYTHPAPARVTNARCADCGWVGQWPKTDAGRRGACPACDEGALVETAAPARVTEEMVERFVDAYVTDLPDPRVAIRDALTSALEADHER